MNTHSQGQDAQVVISKCCIFPLLNFLQLVHLLLVPGGLQQTPAVWNSIETPMPCGCKLEVLF